MANGRVSDHINGESLLIFSTKNHLKYLYYNLCVYYVRSMPPEIILARHSARPSRWEAPRAKTPNNLASPIFSALEPGGPLPRPPAGSNYIWMVTKSGMPSAPATQLLPKALTGVRYSDSVPTLGRAKSTSYRPPGSTSALNHLATAKRGDDRNRARLTNANKQERSTTKKVG